jgi:hypothetical protein
MVGLWNPAHRQVQPVVGKAMVDQSLQPGQSVVQNLEFASDGGKGPYTVRFSLSGASGDFLDSLLGNRRHEEIQAK